MQSLLCHLSVSDLEWAEICEKYNEDKITNQNKLL